MTGKWPGIIFVDENGHPELRIVKTLFILSAQQVALDIKNLFGNRHLSRLGSGII